MPPLIHILSLGNFLIGMGAFVAIGLIEPLADDFAISPAQAGWLMTAYALAYAIGSPVLVSLTGTAERRTIMVGGMALFACAALACALGQSPGQVFAARVVAALGAGLYTPLAAAAAASLVPPERRGRALAAVFFGLTLSQVLGVPVGAWIAYTFGWRWSFALVALLAVPVIAILWGRVPRDLPFAATSLTVLGQTLTDRAAMARVAYTPLLMGGIFVVFTYITPYLSDVANAGRDAIALLLVLCGVAAVVGNLIGGRLSDALTPQRLLILVALCQVIKLTIISLVAMPQTVLFAFITLWATIGWSFNAAQQSRLIGHAPERTSVLLSLNAAGIYVGSAIGGAVGGLVLAYGTVWGLGAAGAVFAALALWNALATNQAEAAKIPKAG